MYLSSGKGRAHHSPAQSAQAEEPTCHIREKRNVQEQHNRDTDDFSGDIKSKKKQKKKA